MFVAFTCLGSRYGEHGEGGTLTINWRFVMSR
jgi:hypothetical protein